LNNIELVVFDELLSIAGGCAFIPHELAENCPGTIVRTRDVKASNVECV